MAEGILTTIGIVKEDAEGNKILTNSAKEGLLRSARNKCTESKPTIAGLEIGITNFLASDYVANGLYMPNQESFLQNKTRNDGWHATWIPAYEKPVVNLFDLESAQILKNIVPIPWPGDPTEAIAMTLNQIKGEIEEYIDDVEAFLKKYIPSIIARLGEVVPILVKFGLNAKDAFKELVDFLASVFEPEGEEVVKKIKKAIEDKKDQLIDKIIEMVAPGIPKLPDIKLPTMATIVELLGVEFEEPIEIDKQLPSLLFPGIPPEVPPGFIIIAFKTIIALIETMISVLTDVTIYAYLFSEFIMKGDFLGLIGALIGIFVEEMLKSIRKFMKIDGIPVFLCTVLAYLEKLIQLCVITTIGHLIGPGLIIQGMADLMELT